MRRESPRLRCVVFDYGFTLSSGRYFNVVPPGVADWETLVQDLIFGNALLTDAWMRGEIGLPDVAALLSRETGTPLEEMLRCLRLGCADLGFNQEVFNFARWVRSSPLRSGLVTANMDVFTQVIVPSHGLEELFDVVVNSADCGTHDKTVLWPIAFARLGPGFCYESSLLIEDGEAHPEAFRSRGGRAHRYRGDSELREWRRRMSLVPGARSAGSLLPNRGQYGSSSGRRPT